jgi:Uma2 family endonuclease
MLSNAVGFDRPESEYLDSEVIERHLGSIPHSAAQARMLEFFDSLKQRSKLFVYPELTLRLSSSRYRVADVAVFCGGRPAGEMYPTDPPEFAVEIVSKEDLFVAIREKLLEYHTWGVKHVWLVDPWNRKCFVYDASGFNEVRAFDMPEYHARISVAEFFAD